MLHKLKQQTNRYTRTVSNRVPNRRARRFLSNHLRLVREDIASYQLRAAIGLTGWTVMRSFHEEDRIAPRSGCFISGRARGTSQRYTVSRTKIKALSDEGKLFGARKSSW